MAKYSFENARKCMIDGQLRPNKVTHKQLLERFAHVPREVFADTPHQDKAYVDTLLPMAEARYMFAPVTIARLLQSLELTPEDEVLVVAGGTGYTASIIAPLVKHVHILEENGYLLDVAKRRMVDLSLENVSFEEKAPETGPTKGKVYDAVIFDAAAEELPRTLIEHLKPAARMAGVFLKEGIYEATYYTREGKVLLETPLFETQGHVLANFAKTEAFVF